MNFIRAKQILESSNLKLVKEEYDLPLDEWEKRGEEEAEDIVKGDAAELKALIKKEYPDAEVYAWDPEPEDKHTYWSAYDSWKYVKEYGCRLELAISPEDLGMTADGVKGEKYSTGLFGLTEEADQKIVGIWNRYYEKLNSEVDYEYYDSFYEPRDKTCRLQMQGSYRFKIQK